MAPNSPLVPSISLSYPAITKQAASTMDGIHTDVMSTAFSDRIMITITQGGRLAQWIHISLDSPNPNFADQYMPSGDDEDALLPMAHLSPKTLLGGSTSERETLGHLYATQIATAIVTRNPEEKRTVLVGLGLSKFEARREVFYDTVDLVMKCL
ncbi:MAG: hypothetical protein ALECFALPRED_003989 [Alectoria fallacina]|uniref:Proteasome assembly chaperone 3 n=1 Tax=Alectoria fallacina TaxID=1903189 RepID=A0A8H3FUZ9_9LECA|nr:MAG: hypothetical protein ALECFALPRED_003989 [Alectoria fallacina]